MSKGALLGQGRTAEIYAWGDDQILKLYRAWAPNDWVEYEARIGRIVCEAGLEVPAIGDLVDVEDRRGVIYERIDGPSMLQIVAKRPWTLPRSARQFAALHAAMHNCSYPDLPAQRRRLQHSINRAPQLTDALKARVLRRLDSLPDGSAVCHGDYHPDNILMADRGPVVIDWVTASQGNSAADVARTVLLLSGGSLPPSLGSVQRSVIQGMRQLFRAFYLRAYQRHRRLSRIEVEIWLPILAAARLDEQIPQEEVALLARVETAFGG